MKRSQVLNYAVVIGVGIALAESVRPNSNIWQDLITGAAFGLLTGFYEWKRAEMRSRHHQERAESANTIRNKLQVVAYAGYIRPDDPNGVIQEAVECIRNVLAAGVAGNAPHPDCSQLAADRKPPRSQRTARSKAMRTGTFS